MNACNRSCCPRFRTLQQKQHTTFFPYRQSNFYPLATKLLIHRAIYPASGRIFARDKSAMGSSPAPLYSLVDIGANMTHPKLNEKLDAVLERAKSAGLKRIMVTGVCKKSTGDAAKLAEAYPELLRYTAGVHPHDAKDHNEEEGLSFIQSHLTNVGCVAIGECGLDFNRNYSPPEVQVAVFERQLKLACELQKPLFVHERDASTKMVEMLTRYQNNLPPTVIHCFTGTVEEAKRYVEMGLHIGVTGFVVKKEGVPGVQEALRTGVIPLNRLLLETDSPFMYPKLPKNASQQQGFSEQALQLHRLSSYACNEPCSLPAICEFVAQLMGSSAEDVARETTANAYRVYGLD